MGVETKTKTKQKSFIFVTIIGPWTRDKENTMDHVYA